MLQHNDTPPGGQTGQAGVTDLFNVLTEQTDANGNTSAAGGAFNSTASFGPYLPSIPVNPLTNSTSVVTIPTTAATTTGWYYNVASGEFHGADTAGNMSDDGTNTVSN